MARLIETLALGQMKAWPVIPLLTLLCAEECSAAYSSTMKAAEKSGTVTETREMVKALVAGEPLEGSSPGLLEGNLDCEVAQSGRASGP
jgi:hypothetical protein